MRLRWFPSLISAAVILLAPSLISITPFRPDLEDLEKTAVVSTVAPEFCQLVVRSYAMGRVEVKVWVNPEGFVTLARAADGPILLRDLAQTAAMQWRFRPASNHTSLREVDLIFDLYSSTETAGGEGEIQVDSTFIPPYYLRTQYRIPMKLDPVEVKNKKCRIHGLIRKVGIVPIAYGLPAERPHYRWARETLFPNSYREVGGGCIDLGKKKAEVFYCQKCRNLEERWLMEHPGNY